MYDDELIKIGIVTNYIHCMSIVRGVEVNKLCKVPSLYRAGKLESKHRF